MRALAVGLLLASLGAASLTAQRPQAAGCRFRLDSVGGLGTSQVVGADTNYYAGGYVRLKCADGSATISSDSVAMRGRGPNTVVQFIGRVRYEDSITVQTADRGTYFRNGDRWEARGHVVTRNKDDGSSIEGPSLDYFRAAPGIRDTVELFATGRPTIRSVPVDSAGNAGEPYLIVADRVRMRGNDRTWAAGQVRVNRSDFAAESDSLYLNSGAGNEGTLIGKPVMRGLGRDSFELRGRRIDLVLEGQAITYVTAVNEGHAISADMDLVADTIGLDLDDRRLVQTVAWGDSIPPKALAGDYEIRGDSVAFDTPGQALREMRAFGHAWVGAAVDSASGERDWMAGDSVQARFEAVDSAGTTRTVLAELSAAGTARSYYRVIDARRTAELPAINYSRGDRITVHMKTTGARGVQRVDIRGSVDGVHLEPLPAVPDSAPPLPPTRSGRR